MAMKPIPVTFHMRAEPRPELLAARRHRARPYRIIVQGVSIFVVMGVGFGYVMSVMVSPKKMSLAGVTPPVVQVSPVSPAPAVASAPPSFSVWQQPALTPASIPAYQPPAPTSVTATVEPVKPSDRTPVATIPAPRSRAPSAFAPMERAPDYSGFKVTAGH